jgi:hypothetical protein
MIAPQDPCGDGIAAQLVIRKEKPTTTVVPGGAPESAPPAVELDDNEVSRRKIQICAQLRILNGCNLSSAISVIGQGAAIGIVDDTLSA